MRNARARNEVLELLRSREPESTSPLIAMMRPSSWRHVKVWVTRTYDGKIGALLISVRYSFDRWYATLLVDDLSCAQEVADVLDHSNVWSVVGPVDGVEAVLAHSKRARGSVRLWFYSIPPQPRSPHVTLCGLSGEVQPGETDSHDLQSLLSRLSSCRSSLA